MPRQTQSASDVEAELDAADGKVLAEGDTDGSYKVTQTLKENDIVILWDRRSGVSSRVRLYDGNNTLVNMLSKRDPETGERIFSRNKPDTVPERGKYPCMLNENHERYSEFQRMGLPRCRRSDMPSEENVMTHMINKHKGAWDLIAERDARARERAYEERQNQMAEAMLALAKSRAE